MDFVIFLHLFDDYNDVKFCESHLDEFCEKRRDSETSNYLKIATTIDCRIFGHDSLWESLLLAFYGWFDERLLG